MVSNKDNSRRDRDSEKTKVLQDSAAGGLTRNPDYQHQDQDARGQSDVLGWNKGGQRWAGIRGQVFRLICHRLLGWNVFEGCYCGVVLRGSDSYFEVCRDRCLANGRVFHNMRKGFRVGGGLFLLGKVFKLLEAWGSIGGVYGGGIRGVGVCGPNVGASAVTSAGLVVHSPNLVEFLG